MFGFKKSPPIDNKSSPVKTGLFASLRDRLTKTRTQLSSGLADIFLGKKKIDDDLLEQLEEQLLISDVGLQATGRIISTLTSNLDRQALKDDESLTDALKSSMISILEPSAVPLTISKSGTPFVILMVGINGAGKTTTVGKLAQKYKQQGKRVMLAAGDTFRAAAVEQLQTWGQRLDIPVISQGQGADSASVIFDALQSAKARNVDVLIADTAGRLHTQSNLMEELEKIKRVMSKIDPEAPHEIILVLDAGTGQNAMAQATQFRDKIGVSGIILTKLDGTARGGMIFSIAEQLKLPVRFIGVGETVEDLREFDCEEFVDALLTIPSENNQ
jgi:fused signal recognition particle receptor